MPYHDWGDKDFDFDELDKIQNWIHKFYKRATKRSMLTKEKYGTIRYEYTYLWLKTAKHSKIFFNIIYRATIKFPEFAGEIVNDLVPIIDDRKSWGAWYKGYFEAILWLRHKSKWMTCK